MPPLTTSTQSPFESFAIKFGRENYIAEADCVRYVYANSFLAHSEGCEANRLIESLKLNLTAIVPPSKNYFCVCSSEVDAL